MWKRRLSCKYSRRLLRQNIANLYPEYLNRVVSRCIFRCFCRSHWLESFLLRHIYPHLVLAALSLQGATCSSGAGIHTHSPTDDPASGAIWGSGASFKGIVNIVISPPTVTLQPHVLYGCVSASPQVLRGFKDLDSCRLTQTAEPRPRF